ncbi:MAG TPA: hypothetical protein PKW49_14165 [Paludibacteraceae bacterium]|nr:hypothetical protein [Paludibacteraceae bacterium]
MDKTAKKLMDFCEGQRVALSLEMKLMDVEMLRLRKEMKEEKDDENIEKSRRYIDMQIKWLSAMTKIELLNEIKELVTTKKSNHGGK